MSYRSKAKIYDGQKFSVTSYGNGDLFAVVRKSDNTSFCCQGEAVGEFRETVLEQDVFTVDVAIEHYYGPLFAEGKGIQ